MISSALRLQTVLVFVFVLFLHLRGCFVLIVLGTLGGVVRCFGSYGFVLLVNILIGGDWYLSCHRYADCTLFFVCIYGHVSLFVALWEVLDTGFRTATLLPDVGVILGS